MYRQSERRINIVQKALFPLTASWPDLGLFAQSLVAYIVETFSAFPWHFRLLLHPRNGIAKQWQVKWKVNIRPVFEPYVYPIKTSSAVLVLVLGLAKTILLTSLNKSVTDSRLCPWFAIIAYTS